MCLQRNRDGYRFWTQRLMVEEGTPKRVGLWTIAVLDTIPIEVSRLRLDSKRCDAVVHIKSILKGWFLMCFWAALVVLVVVAVLCCLCLFGCRCGLVVREEYTIQLGDVMIWLAVAFLLFLFIFLLWLWFFFLFALLFLLLLLLLLFWLLSWLLFVYMSGGYCCCYCYCGCWLSCCCCCCCCCYWCFVCSLVL